MRNVETPAAIVHCMFRDNLNVMCETFWSLEFHVYITHALLVTNWLHVETWSTITMEGTLTSDVDHLGDIAYPASQRAESG